MDYIATFHTHFGATAFHGRLRAAGDTPTMMPVPRSLSASCGTCVRFSLPFVAAMADEDLDAVYAQQAGGYQLLFRNEEE